ncbi:hypothetical protein [Spirosoma sp. 209]|uniref:hypothetical protein n=1 Tax=Spirosoma sp. 209 TaxID=1955701 RepID=UPI00098D40B0|nr:hypothetical protein [Spirosoma sp. 209]
MTPTTTSITSSADYLNYWNGIRQGIDQEFSQVTKTPAQLKDFFAFVANKRRFLPEHEQDELTFYKNLLHNQRVNLYLDFKTDISLLLDRFTVSGDLGFLQQPGPFVFCTFHFGPFPLIGYQLNRLGFTASVLTIEGISNSMIHQDTTEGLDIMHSGSTSVMVEMMSNLEAGRSVMAFVDGNLGVVKEIDPRSFVPVPLLNDTFFCKKGVPLLSYLTNTPIIPLITYRQGPDDIRMVVDAPIYPDRQLSRDVYAQSVLQRCYALFERHLRKTPEQWEFWNLIGKYMASELQRGGAPIPAPVEATHYLFNRERYDLIQVQTTPFLFDRQTRGYFPISATLAQVLGQLSPKGVAIQSQLSPALFNDLLQRSVLRAA